MEQRIVWREVDYWTAVEYSGDAVLLSLRDQWHTFNRAHFDSRLTLPRIVLLAPSTTGLYGQYTSDEIGIKASVVDGTHPHVSGSPQGCFRFALDVLIHEMIHQAGHDDHRRGFAKQAESIGATLGLPRVRGNAIYTWPQSVRKKSFYLGAYHPN